MGGGARGPARAAAVEHHDRDTARSKLIGDREAGDAGSDDRNIGALALRKGRGGGDRDLHPQRAGAFLGDVHGSLPCQAALRLRVRPRWRGAERLEAVPRRPFVPRRWRSASMRLMTLSGFSAGAAGSIFLPAALRWTSLRSAISFSSLNFFGSQCAALGAWMCPASSSTSLE